MLFASRRTWMRLPRQFEIKRMHHHGLLGRILPPERSQVVNFQVLNLASHLSKSIVHIACKVLRLKRHEGNTGRFNHK